LNPRKKTTMGMNIGSNSERGRVEKLAELEKGGKGGEGGRPRLVTPPSLWRNKAPNCNRRSRLGMTSTYQDGVTDQKLRGEGTMDKEK